MSDQPLTTWGGLRGAVADVFRAIRTKGTRTHSITPSVSWPWNWWQYGPTAQQDHDYGTFGPIQTCINILSQDISRIPLTHVRESTDRSREMVFNAAPARLFRRPNSYQTRSDWLLYIMRALLSDGNSYSWAKRNGRGEVIALYPLPSWSVYPYIVPETAQGPDDEGTVVYQISQSPVLDIAKPNIEEGWWVRSKDILHVRLQTPKHPLIGESPLLAAKFPAITGSQINKSSASFFSNMSRPGGILRHPGELKEEAMKRIKERFKEITGQNSIGDVAVLSEGMEWQQLQMTAVDAEVAAIYTLSERQIFQIFRIPPFLGGDLEKATFSNVESLTRFYLQSCLGFYVDHLEEALTLFFGLPPDEKILFDLDQALLAGDLKERMEAYGKGVQNGILAPNEARRRENLPPVEFGDEPRVQQQLVPLSFGVVQVADAAAGVGAQPPGAPPADTDPPTDDPNDADEPDTSGETERGLKLVYSEELKRVTFR